MPGYVLNAICMSLEVGVPFHELKLRVPYVLSSWIAIVSLSVRYK